MKDLAELFTSQYLRSWKGFEDTVRGFAVDKWRTGDVDYLIPARAAYHILETADFYSGDTPVDFPWGYRFNCDWEGAAPEALPTQDDVMAYLDEMKSKVATWLHQVDVNAKDDNFPWCGGTVADRALYLLRHNHHHIGEMWSQLKRCGHDLPDWQ